MQTTMLIFRPGQEVEKQEIDLPPEPGYHRLNEIVGPLLDGGDLEQVNVLFDGGRRDMFVNDIGHMLHLPRNEAATEIYRAASIARNPEIDPESIPHIVGPAIVFDRRVWF